MLDLYVCLRPVQWFAGVPSPVKHPELVNMVIFRENTEDIYAGIEFAAGTPDSQKVLDFIAKEFPKSFEKIRFGTKAKAEGFWNEVGAKDFPSDVQVGIGIKPVSYSGSVRLVHTAISYAIKFKRKSVTIVHKGNIMKNTEGAFRDWGYKVAKEFFGAVDVNQGWTDKFYALDMIRWLNEQNVLFVEQPLPKHMVSEMQWLTENSPLPTIAD